MIQEQSSHLIVYAKKKTDVIHTRGSEFYQQKRGFGASSFGKKDGTELSPARSMLSTEKIDIGNASAERTIGSTDYYQQRQLTAAQF
jgi:hypothetical protein